MMTRNSCALLVALVVAAAPASALAANREHQQLMADIRMLQEQTQHLQLLLGTLSEALRTVTAKIDDQSNLNRKAFADQRLLVDGVAGDVRVVREKVDETNVRISSLSQEIEALRTAIPPPSPATTSEASQTAAPPAGATPGAPPEGAPPTPAAPPAAPTMSPSRLYEMARADYMAGQWTLSIQGFESYLKTFPRSELADDAQFYIGEAYFADVKDKEAVAAYDKVITNYPGANRVPDAYYKRGLALQRLGQDKQAIESFEFAVKTFPDSDAGRLAKQRLDRMPKKP